MMASELSELEQLKRDVADMQKGLVAHITTSTTQDAALRVFMTEVKNGFAAMVQRVDECQSKIMSLEAELKEVRDWLRIREPVREPSRKKFRSSETQTAMVPQPPLLPPPPLRPLPFPPQPPTAKVPAKARPYPVNANHGIPPPKYSKMGWDSRWDEWEPQWELQQWEPQPSGGWESTGGWDNGWDSEDWEERGPTEWGIQGF